MRSQEAESSQADTRLVRAPDGDTDGVPAVDKDRSVEEELEEKPLDQIKNEGVGEYMEKDEDVKVEIVKEESGEKYSDVGEDISRLLNDGETADFTLKSSSSSKEFRVHRAILAARSNVFRMMLFSGSGSGEGVMVCEVPEEALEQVIQFIYTGQLANNLPDIQSLCFAADKFRLDKLMELICNRLRTVKLEDEEVADVFIASHLHSQETLFDVAMEKLRLKKGLWDNVTVKKKMTAYGSEKV